MWADIYSPPHGVAWRCEDALVDEAAGRSVRQVTSAPAALTCPNKREVNVA